MCLMDCSEALNVAVTEVVALMLMVQVPVPEHAPDHPANTEPSLLLGVAVKLTAEPLLKLALQDWLQAMPPGVLLTFPVPGPAMVRFSCELLAWELGVGGGGELWLALEPPPPQAIRAKSDIAAILNGRHQGLDIGATSYSEPQLLEMLVCTTQVGCTDPGCPEGGCCRGTGFCLRMALTPNSGVRG